MEISNSYVPSVDEMILHFQNLDEQDKQKFLAAVIQKPSKKRPRRVFEEEFKVKAVDIWKANGNYLMTADLLSQQLKDLCQAQGQAKEGDYEEEKIHESYIRRWTEERLSKEEIEAVKKRVKKTKVKQAYPELEQRLTNWFGLQRSKKLVVTMKQFKDQALRIFEDLKTKYTKTGEEALKIYCEGEFKASAGWFRRFRKRQKISRRAATHVASKLSEDYTTEIASFIGRIRELR